MPRSPTKICKDKECKNKQTTMGYCRLHYLQNWKKIRDKQKKKAAVNLNKYVDFVMKKHPDNYVEAIKHDLRNPERFQKQADQYAIEDDFHDVLEDVDISAEVSRIISHIKIDDTF